MWMYYRSVSGVLLFVGLQSRKSFESVPRWAYRISKEQPGCQFIVVGTKLDLGAVFTKEELQKFAEGVGWPVILTSVKDGTNINEVFAVLLALIFAEQEISHPRKSSSPTP
jgi:GTPase SAR1 family protein